MNEIGHTSDGGEVAVICGELKPDAIQVDTGVVIPAVCTRSPDHGGDFHRDDAFGHQWPRVRPVKVDPEPDVQDEPEAAGEPASSPVPTKLGFRDQFDQWALYGRIEPFSLVLGVIGGFVAACTLIVLIRSGS